MPGFFLQNMTMTGPVAMLQDYVGAVTRNAINVGFGHTDRYYGSTTDTRPTHCTEAYANWVACHGNQPTDLA